MYLFIARVRDVFVFENGGAGLGAVDPARAVRPKPGVWDPDFGHRGGPGGVRGGSGGPKTPDFGGGSKKHFFSHFFEKKAKKMLVFACLFFRWGAKDALRGPQQARRFSYQNP